MMLVVGFAFACGKMADIPTEFPTPEPPPQATPVPKMNYQRDAGLERQIAGIAAAARGKVGVAAVVEQREGVGLGQAGHDKLGDEVIDGSEVAAHVGAVLADVACRASGTVR